MAAPPVAATAWRHARSSKSIAGLYVPLGIVPPILRPRAAVSVSVVVNYRSAEPVASCLDA